MVELSELGSLEITNCFQQQHSLIFEETQGGITLMTEEATDLHRLVAMIHTDTAAPPDLFPTNLTLMLLLEQEVLELGFSKAVILQLIEAVSVALAVSSSRTLSAFRPSSCRCDTPR